MNQPEVSFILASRNRCEILIDTLRRIQAVETFAGAREIIVVDNASSDGTAQAVRREFDDVQFLSLRRNLGSCAKALGVDRACGRHIVFLDDDSHPRPGSVARMIERFDGDERLGAAGFVVHLPDGRLECSAFPNVFVGCGVGFRTDALRAVGGLDAGWFMQAEEFDLSFRLVNAGWGVETFADLHVDHLKTPRARVSARTTYYDTRNNLLLVDRYLPEPYRRIYRSDWKRRYRWLAIGAGHRSAFLGGWMTACIRRGGQRRRFAHQRLGTDAFETLFRWREVRSRMAALRDGGVRRVVLADLGKNVFAFYQGARDCELAVEAIADDRFFATGRRYRGVPIVRTADIHRLRADAVVVSNTAPVHAAATAKRLEAFVAMPVHCWFRPGSTRSDLKFSCSEASVFDDTRAALRAPRVAAAGRART